MKTAILILIVIASGAFLKQTTSCLDLNIPSFEKMEAFDNSAMSSSGFFQNQLLNPSKKEVNSKLTGISVQLFKKILLPLGCLALLMWGMMCLGIFNSIKKL